MTRSSAAISPSFAVMGAIALALSLAGCGRKTGLDLPPAAAARAQTPADAPRESGAAVPGADPFISADPTVYDSGPAAARGQKRRIFLDPILD